MRISALFSSVLPPIRPSVYPSIRLSVQLRFQQRPLRCLSGQVLERIGQVIAVMEEIYSARALLKQEREERGIRLGGVAGDTGQHQVIRPVVGRLASTRPHMVQRDDVRGCRLAAIGANRAVTLEEPLAMRLEGPPWRPLER